MAANSKHYGDVYLWLIKVIMSCETHDQHFNARAMIRRFQYDILKTYNLPVSVSTEIHNKLDEAINEGLINYLEKESDGKEVSN